MTPARITATLGFIAAVVFGLTMLALALGAANEVLGHVIQTVGRR